MANPDDARVLKYAFAPILGEHPRVLILGSMPGEASLRLGQYYGHGRNAFWPILQALLAIPTDADYAARTAALTAAGIALWDVIAACERAGSLDSAIRPDSVRVNDFRALLDRHPGIRCIAFNGATAEREFARRAHPLLRPHQQRAERLRLPSTSPAYAGMSFDAKLAAWRILLTRL
ncbi:MAG: DNA-deoxyinosine glycosylase [Thiohalocapsa sp.]|nr:DNA-deoxyinosine glycosylase [Thiohalocapsa sp.]MCF7991277.1 DNA-deoxyinosine glycosylase [Thiohalocapsa sp.]